MPLLFDSSVGGQGYSKLRPDTELTLRRNSATVHLDYSLAYRQAESGASMGSGKIAVDLMERSEDQIQVLGRDAKPGVADNYFHDSRGPLHLDAYPALGRGELHGVGQQVEDDLTESPGIGFDNDEWLIRALDEFDGTVLEVWLDDFDRLPEHREQVHCTETEFLLAGLDPSQVEEVVDQLEKMIARSRNGLDIFELF